MNKLTHKDIEKVDTMLTYIDLYIELIDLNTPESTKALINLTNLALEEKCLKV